MIQKGQIDLILRKINSNDCALFVGAGFSADVKNGKGDFLPIGSALAGLLSEQLYGKGTPSIELRFPFETFLKKKGPHVVSDYFRGLYEARDIPSYYNLVARIPWYRIYGINIDDVVETVFNREKAAVAELDTIVATEEDFRDRNAYIEPIQYVKMHGDLASDPSRWTFGIVQYGKRAGDTQDKWYSQFADDYVNKSFVFVGTKLDEPLFFQYLEARKTRGAKLTGKTTFDENRPPSFLVVPDLPVGYKEFFRDLNITHIAAGTEEFLGSLAARESEVLSTADLLANKFPEYGAELKKTDGVAAKRRKMLVQEFLLAFQRVPDNPKPPKPKHYLLGFEATWGDLIQNNDAPREVAESFYGKVTSSMVSDKALAVHILTGHAGSGKTTTMMRTAWRMKLEGFDVFFSKGYKFPKAENIAAFLDRRSTRAALFIDNSDLVQGALPYLIEELLKLKSPPCVVLASQTNLYWTFKEELEKGIVPTRTVMQHLSSRDIDKIIDILDREGLLGNLQGRPRHEQRNDFEKVAKNQILVAMRLATKGDGFKDIIRREYEIVNPDAARSLLLCVALASVENLPLTRGQYLRCSDVEPNEALNFLNAELEDEVVSDELHPEFLYSRHPLIASEIIDHAAGKDHLFNAYKKVLLALADDIDFSLTTRRYNSVAYKLFKSIINHEAVFRRFQSRISLARDIFESIRARVDRDWHFWLQYGLLELSYGEHQLAENYLDQAKAIYPRNDWVIHSIAKLKLAQALEADSIAEAESLKNEAILTLEAQLKKPHLLKEYPYDILISGLEKWIVKWVTEQGQKASMLKDLCKLASEAVSSCPGDERLQERERQVRYLLLSCGISNP